VDRYWYLKSNGIGVVTVKSKRWYIDAVLAAIVVILGILVVFRLKDVFAAWRGDAETDPAAAAERGAAATTESSAAPASTDEPTEAATDEPADEPTDEPAVEQAADPPLAPKFSLTNLEGETVTLLDYLGTPVMINFWATWFPPCRAEMPVIQQFQDDFEGEFVVLAVNGGETEAEVRGFMEANDFTLTFLLDPENSVAQQYGIRGFPTSIFVDSEGYLQAYHIGEVDEDLLTRYLALIGVGE
jgi:thiol-disulfide isomerase/thioredoxin